MQIEDAETNKITHNHKLKDETENSDTDTVISYSAISDTDEENTENKCNTEEVPARNAYLVYVIYSLYFVFWATCYAISIELGFGIVYLLFSALFGIYFNTRTGPKPKNEISAYSVFNKDQHSIDGTLTAEQFEREIRYGPTSVRQI